MDNKHMYSSIITDYFFIFEHLTESNVLFRPGLDLLAGSLIRCAAHNIYIPYKKIEYGQAMAETIKSYPPSLQNRIKIIDENRKDFERVSNYFEPIYKDLKDSPLTLCCNFVTDFVYKLLLAAKYKSEADIGLAIVIGGMIQVLQNHIKSAEARIRLDQILGIYSNYSNPLRIETFTIYPNASEPSIYEKISDFLDEGEIIELSQNRFLLGIPSKAKAALIRFNKGVRHFLKHKKYDKYIKASTELIQIAGIQTIKIPNIDFLKEFYSYEYNPPITNLDFYRVQACKEVSPNHSPNIILPERGTMYINEEQFGG